MARVFKGRFAGYPEPRYRSSKLVKPYHLIIAALICDIVMIALASTVSGFVFLRRYPDIDHSDYALAATFTTVLAVAMSSVMGAYKVDRDLSLRRQLQFLISGFSFSILLLVFALFLFKSSSEYSRGWVVGWALSGTFAMIVGRSLLTWLKVRWTAEGRLRKNVAIVGTSKQAARAVAALRERDGEKHFNVVGVFDPGTDDLLSVINNSSVDQVVIALPRSAHTRVSEIASVLYPYPVNVSVSFEDERRINTKPIRRIGDLAVLDILDKPLVDWCHTVKTIEDKVLGTLALMSVMPLFVLIAIAIKLDSPGPVFFRQKRYGCCNELIGVYKFRTMHVTLTDALGAELTRRNDPRITRVGAFLRRFSLDELPQFINVVKGDMSVVGPRPHPILAKAGDQLYGEAVANYALRHRVKPGITGWAQINGWRGETDTIEKITKRVEHDIYYIENWSLWLDMEIIFRTVLVIFRKDAAF